MLDVFSEDFVVAYFLHFIDRVSVPNVVHHDYSMAWSFASDDVVEPEKVIAYENSTTAKELIVCSMQRNIPTEVVRV